MRNFGLRMLAAVTLAACQSRSGAAQASSSSPNVAQIGSRAAVPEETCWRKLVEQQSTIEQRITADLDADGVSEVVVLSSTVDPDLVKTEGVTQDQIRSNLNIRVRVFEGRDGGCAAIEGPEMTGRVVPLIVSPLEGGGKRQFIIATALHCGASCAGIELHVVTIRQGRIVNLLDLDSVDKGEVTVTPRGELAVREAIYRGGKIVGHRLKRYVVNGEVLTVASESAEQ